ncbi:MAG: hypothetical protein AAF636_25225 [Pseudomonadota bacterium]
MSIARELLDRHEKLLLADANEAETRLKLIDRIVFEILGWGHYDVRFEQRVSEDGKTTFSDYILTTGFSSLVIEAKRVGRSDLEVADKRKVLLDRRFVSGDTGEAIVQARDYGRKRPFEGHVLRWTRTVLLPPPAPETQMSDQLTLVPRQLGCPHRMVRYKW